jgi:hypothetical protein
MKIRFASKVAAAAAAGLMAAACGESAPDPETPATRAAEGGGDAMGDEGGDMMDSEDEGGDEAGSEQAACCKGMNECKGKGGCAVAGKNDCQAKNECKGQGGCNQHCPSADG